MVENVPQMARGPVNPAGVSGPEAQRRFDDEPERFWPNAIDRFDESPFPVHHDPKFSLSASGAFFCMGSCFANNIEEHLIYNGVQVLSRRIVCPREECNVRPNAIANKFTVASMLNEIRWLDAPPDPETLLCELPNGMTLDLQLSPNAQPVTRARAVERRHYLHESFYSRLRQTDNLIVSLGIDEVWYDRMHDRYLNRFPPKEAIQAEPNRYELRVLDVPSTVDMLEEMRDRLKAIRPNLHWVLTVSPVAIRASFTVRDPAVAMLRAKSMLRSAAESFSSRHRDVDYFPSYEMVMLSPRASVFDPDCRHVADRVVAEITRRFMALYLGLEGTAPEGYFEAWYLEAHPDVELAVREAVFTTGFDHWVQYGRAEGRRLRLPEREGQTPIAEPPSR